MGSSPASGLCADSSKPGACCGFCVSLSLCPSPAHSRSLCLSLSKKKFFFSFKFKKLFSWKSFCGVHLEGAIIHCLSPSNLLEIVQCKGNRGRLGIKVLALFHCSFALRPRSLDLNLVAFERKWKTRLFEFCIPVLRSYKKLFKAMHSCSFQKFLLWAVFSARCITPKGIKKWPLLL